MSDLTAAKEVARKAAYTRRKAAHEPGGAVMAAARLLEFLEPHAGQTISGYMPIKTEIDPLDVMAKMVLSGFVTVPVIEAAGRALKFRQWAPDCEMVAGPFGAKVPATGAWLEPEVLIVPLVAFDRSGGRLGYGGGFYDRTLQSLGSHRPTIAVGFAYAAQETEGLPLEATDQPLDAIVTERETLVFG